MTTDRRTAALVWVSVSLVLASLARPAAAPDVAASVYRGADTRLAPHDDIAASALSQAWPQLEWSSCLATAAQVVLELTGGSDAMQLPDGLLRDVTTWTACPDPSPTAVILDTSESSLVDVVGELRRLRARTDEPFTHAGVARSAIERGRYRWRWVVVLAARSAELADDVTRRHGAGDVVPVRFRIDPDLSAPTMMVARPDGRLTRQQLVEKGGHWWTLVHVGPIEGVVTVQLTADTRTGHAVLAVLELWVGEPPQASLMVGRPSADRPDLGAGERARSWMVDRINDFRRAAGRSVVARDPVLDLVATAHSEDMYRAGFVGHRSPTRGDVSERLDAAGVDFRSARENIAWAADVEDALRQLRQSPSHRVNLLAPEVDRVGIGIVATPEEGSGRTVLVTQIFTRAPPSVDPDRILAAATEAVDRRHQARGAPPLRRCAELDLAAAALADEPYATALDTDTSFVRARDALEPRSERWGSLKLAVVRVSEPREVELPMIFGWEDAVAWGVAVRHLPLEALPEYQVVWVASADIPWKACD